MKTTLILIDYISNSNEKSINDNDNDIKFLFYRFDYYLV